MHAMVRGTMAAVKSTEGGCGGAAASSKEAGCMAPAKKETRGVQLNMDGLLGKREHEDEYIKALLMVDGVTSVTIDRVRCCCWHAGRVIAT